MTLIELKTISWKENQGKKTIIDICTVRKYHPIFLNKWKPLIFLNKWSIAQVLCLGPRGSRNVCPKWAWTVLCIKKSNKSRRRRQTRGCMIQHAIKKRNQGFLSTASYLSSISYLPQHTNKEIFNETLRQSIWTW